MSSKPVTTNNLASEPAESEVENRAIELAKADGLVWAAPGTPEQGAGSQIGAASNEERERYRKLARERLEAERGLIIS